MDFEDYKTKNQRVSSIISNAKCPEDVLNNNEINLENDFQYVCMNCNINNELVNEVIARLAQNGNRNVVENNVQNISVSMWKDLFNQNKEIKDIFKENFEQIINGAGILTFRDLQKIIEDDELQDIVYDNIDKIVKKLCTYDRTSFIACIKNKENGVEAIKKNIDLFFQKGEYDISTTYSKILVELCNIPEVSKLEILESCSKFLGEMLERETAIDNESNDLLNWIYDAMEETHMYNEQREIIQKDIDNAIMDNFDSILDKANYDKETIKVLKLFSCTHERFGEDKNEFIVNSTKLIHMTKIYDLNTINKSNEVVSDKCDKSECDILNDEAKDEIKYETSNTQSINVSENADYKFSRSVSDNQALVESSTRFSRILKSIKTALSKVKNMITKRSIDRIGD